MMSSQERWKEAYAEKVTMKRVASANNMLDESPVSIDAAFHEVMIPSANDGGDRGWCALPPLAPSRKGLRYALLIELCACPQDRWCCRRGRRCG